MKPAPGKFNDLGFKWYLTTNDRWRRQPERSLDFRGYWNWPDCWVDLYPLSYGRYRLSVSDGASGEWQTKTFGSLKAAEIGLVTYTLTGNF